MLALLLSTTVVTTKNRTNSLVRFCEVSESARLTPDTGSRPALRNFTSFLIRFMRCIRVARMVEAPARMALSRVTEASTLRGADTRRGRLYSTSRNSVKDAGDVVPSGPSKLGQAMAAFETQVPALHHTNLPRLLVLEATKLSVLLGIL